MDSSNYVVKISSALSPKPFFIKIDNPDISIDQIFTRAIAALRESGSPLESEQLETLYREHSIFNEGKLVEKGQLFKDLKTHQQSIGNQNVFVAELDLVTRHSGGYINPCSK